MLYEFNDRYGQSWAIEMPESGVGVLRSPLNPEQPLWATDALGSEVLRLVGRVAALETVLRVLAPLCIDALREAEGISEEELYDQLQKAGLIELTLFDPEKHGEIEGAETGFEIWVLTDLGKEFAEAKGGE